MGIRAYMQKQRLIKENQKIVRQKKIKNLSEIESAFALVSLKTMDDYKKWENIFKNISFDKFNIEWYTYLIDNSKNNTDLPSNVFTKNDVGYWGFPKKAQILKGKFSNTYDLTLDLNFDNVYLLNWIWVNIDSKLRVGSDYKQEMFPYYDFTMSTKNPADQSKLFIDQVFYFLDNINK